MRAKEARELATANEPNRLSDRDQKLLDAAIGVLRAAANKGSRQASLNAATPPAVVNALAALGYRCHIQTGVVIGPSKPSTLEVHW